AATSAKGLEASPSSGASVARSRVTKAAAASRSAALRLARGSEGCRSEVSPRRSFASSARNAASACASPAVPGRGRGPRRTGVSKRRDRARVGAFGGAEPRERMLEEGEQRNRGKPAERGVRRQPREPPGGGIRERIAAGIVDRDLPAFERRQHPARQGAVGRDQGRGLVRR